LRLQLCHMPAHGGLAGFQDFGGAQQAARIQRGEEGADQLPVEWWCHGLILDWFGCFLLFNYA
jgi:hypothetical protein